METPFFPDSAVTPLSTPKPPRFSNGQQWHESLGGVPLSRVLFSPLPGFATEADLVALADRDTRYCELIGGTLVERPSSKARHDLVWRAIGVLSFRLASQGFLIRHAAAVMRMPSGNVRAPDIAAIRLDRLPGRVKPVDRVPTLSPEFVAEALSDGNTSAEIGLKLAEYFEAGTRLAWVIDPALKQVRVHYAPERPEQVLGLGDTIGGGNVLPWLSLPVVRLFERPYHQED